MSSRDKAAKGKATAQRCAPAGKNLPSSSSSSSSGKLAATNIRSANKKPNNQTKTKQSVVSSIKSLKPNVERPNEIVDDKNLNEMATTNFQNDNGQLLADERSKLMEREEETDVDAMAVTSQRPGPEIGSPNDNGDDDEEEEASDERTGFLLGEAPRNQASAGASSKVASSAKEASASPGMNDLKTAQGSSGVGPLPHGWEQHCDKLGLYYWHVASGVIQRTRPSSELSPRKEPMVFYHDDEEINQAQKNSSDDDDYYESGAALTVDDTSESTFVVYATGCCEFDETQLVPSNSTKAIQKCILRLSNRPPSAESACWGLDQSQPVLMRLFDDHIQFTDLNTRTLLRSQPIQTIKTWAVDDDNNFAFVIEDRPQSSSPSTTGAPNSPAAAADYSESLDYALLSAPTLICYVFRSDDDDDMSCKVAAKLNEEINRYKEQMSNRISKSTRMQQMVQQVANDQQTDAEEELDDELEASNELTMNVKYIGKAPVPRPTGIEILNVAIDKCLADAADKAQADRLAASQNGATAGGGEPSIETFSSSSSPLIEAKLHVSPSSVIVENVVTGEIIVECRIRFLTFMGISRRDIRWCGFIMQNATNKTFVAHCFECHPTAGHVCEAIQVSCTKMYEKVVKSARQPEAISIIPTGSKIRHTLAKTFSRIKLNPIR